MTTVQQTPDETLAALLNAVEDDNIRDIITIVWERGFRSAEQHYARLLQNGHPGVWPNGEVQSVRQFADRARPTLTLVPLAD